jgi:7-cyano-7-deazaguanine synthase
MEAFRGHLKRLRRGIAWFLLCEQFSLFMGFLKSLLLVDRGLNWLQVTWKVPISSVACLFPVLAAATCGPSRGVKFAGFIAAMRKQIANHPIAGWAGVLHKLKKKKTSLSKRLFLIYTSVKFMSVHPEVVVLFSGGLDSAACAHYLQKHGHAVRGLFVEYGQKAACLERAAAEQLSAFLCMNLSTMRVETNRSFGNGEIQGRNAFLVFSCMLGADSAQTQVIALGIHAGTAYYDCSPAFLESIDRLVAEYTDGRTRVVAPFLEWTKHDIFTYCVREHLPIDLSYSCEAGETPPCGLCLSCRDRRALSCLS